MPEKCNNSHASSPKVCDVFWNCVIFCDTTFRPSPITKTFMPAKKFHTWIKNVHAETSNDKSDVKNIFLVADSRGYIVGVQDSRKVRFTDFFFEPDDCCRGLIAVFSKTRLDHVPAPQTDASIFHNNQEMKTNTKSSKTFFIDTANR